MDPGCDSEHPELTGRQVGDKCEVMRSEHSEHPAQV